MRRVLAIALVLAGCGGSDDAPPVAVSRGPFGGRATTGTTVTSDEPAVARAHQDLDTLDREALHVTPPRTEAPSAGTSPASGGAASGATTEEERNYGAELATAIGSPASCLDTATARTLHGRLSIQVSATVTPSGSVTRATASGSALPEAVLTCVQSRALSVHLAGGIEGAPRTISTSLTFEVTTTDDEITRETPVWHQPGAVAEPGHVLPAGGTEGRPEGSVGPDSTLPAQVPSGRVEGTVAPDILLPARGR